MKSAFAFTLVSSAALALQIEQTTTDGTLTYDELYNQALNAAYDECMAVPLEDPAPPMPDDEYYVEDPTL